MALGCWWPDPSWRVCTGEALLSVLGLVFSVWGGSVWRDAVGFQGTKWNLTFKISI